MPEPSGQGLIPVAGFAYDLPSGGAEYSDYAGCA
jgi:hypothetical protein